MRREGKRGGKRGEEGRTVDTIAIWVWRSEALRREDVSVDVYVNLRKGERNGRKREEKKKKKELTPSPGNTPQHSTRSC